MKRILVTGAGGQLAESIRAAASENSLAADLVFTGLSDLDLTDDKNVISFFDSMHFDYMINCAAYTAVDMAEQNPSEAFAVNAKIPALLGQIACEKKIKLIHISSDYVFNGLSPLPYNEKSMPDPVSVYGKSKREGELPLTENPSAMIIRTSWLYSEYGKNFMKTIIKLGMEKDSVGVVFDQTGSPTYAPDLASAILDIIGLSEKQGFPAGMWHFSNEGVASWFDLAWEIISITGYSCRIYPITTDEFPLPAKRPAYSVLDCSRIKKELGIGLKYWKSSLEKAIERLPKI
jgi:dTDP-4-dehydrorhamnose reductase